MRNSQQLDEALSHTLEINMETDVAINDEEGRPPEAQELGNRLGRHLGKRKRPPARDLTEILMEEDSSSEQEESSESEAWDAPQLNDFLPDYLRVFPPYGMFISSIFEIEDFLKALPTGALVLWDYDYTIRQPSSNILSRQNNQERELFYYLLSQLPGGKKLKAAVYKNNTDQMTEPKLATLIDELQQKDIFMMGCTMQSSNNRHEVTAQLSAFEIDFKKSAPTKTKKIRFSKEDYPAFVRKQKANPMYYKGVLYCGSRSKGEVVEAYLNEIDFKPSMVVLIDDKHGNHQSLKAFSERTGIAVYAFMQHVTRVNNVIDPKVLSFQYQYLKDHQQWLTDAEASEAIHRKDSVTFS